MVSLLATRAATSRWLAENGPRELESLFRSVTFHPCAPVLLADDDRCYHDASVGASRLLGLQREEIIGRHLDDFAAAEAKPAIADRWREFLQAGEQAGTLRLLGPDGILRDIQYTARRNVLPVRHLVWLDAKPEPSGTPASPRDYALFLLDSDGLIADWYAGAERLYHYTSGEAAGRHVSILYPSDGQAEVKMAENLKRAVGVGHGGIEADARSRRLIAGPSGALERYRIRRGAYQQ